MWDSGHSVIVTPPATEPVTLTEVKSQRHISGTDHDTELTRLISAARQYVENYLGRALITQTWDYFIDEFMPVINFPLAPLQSVTTVKYYDTAGVQQTLNAALYTVNSNSDPGYIVPAYNQSWPDIRYIPDAVEIRIIAGYGDATTDIPEQIRNAIFLLIGHWHENTEESQPFNMNQIPYGVAALLDPYRVWRL